MKFTFFSSLVGLLFICRIVPAQEQTEVLMTINGNPVTKAEFERIYKKNDINLPGYSPQSLDSSLEMFINFRLKVAEAEKLKFDTASSFVSELKGYRDQLAKSYLTAQDMLNEMEKEAYYRLKNEVNVRHILIRISPSAISDDTLKAYQKALSVRKMVIGGEPFAQVAAKLSDDSLSKNNAGNLGYISAFKTGYAFESAAYSTPEGSVSMPVRTREGYHLLEVTDTRTDPGEIKVAHIMIIVPFGSDVSKDDSARNAINQIYVKLKNGEDFSTLSSEYSEDRSTAKEGGVLPWFGPGKMIPEFETAAFALQKNGDFSKPVHTPYGWHIIKRIDRKAIPPFEQLEGEIRKKIENDPERQYFLREIFIKRLKKEYAFKEDKKNLLPFYSLGNADFSSAKGLSKPLFSFDNKTFSQKDFGEFMKQHPGTCPIKDIDNLYNEFVEESLMNFENSRLEQKYPEFRYITQEYHDGILLFNITDSLVWSKAITDTTGLIHFYEVNKDNYLSGKRLEATIYSCPDANKTKTAYQLVKKSKYKFSDPKLVEKVCGKSNDHPCLQIEHKIFSQGENKLLDSIGWNLGLTNIIDKDGSVIFISRDAELKPQPKPLNEIKGLVTADYQSYLENQWIKELRKKYTIELNRKILYSIK
ncbi:MAG: peptidylprolyl isomerase [Bacteroidota bacterium]|nr:peptidylprolyl isomerase [Bacteroidota bacterium]